MEHVDEDTFVVWLKKTKLISYQAALEEEGYEDLQSLTLMTEEQIDALSTAIEMKPGHKIKFGPVVKQAREELEKLDAKRKREEEEEEEQRKREKGEEEEQREREKQERNMDMELAKVERKLELDRKLAQAKAQRDQLVDVDEQSKGDVKSATHNSTVANEKSESKSIVLPAIKSYAAFISHKKTHSTQGDSSSTLARSLKDMLKWRSIKAYFDADNLSTISKEKLKEGVEASCCLLLVLNDETLQSAWCQFEIDCARSKSIPVICVCDVDKQLLRATVDFYMESSHAYLFDEQVIAYSTQSREHSHTLIIEAIARAVQSALRQKQSAPVAEPPQPKPDRVHELDDDLQSGLMAALRLKFGTAKAAFDSVSNEGSIITKKEWRRMIKTMLPAITQADAKALKKKLPKKVSLGQFCELMDEVKSKGEQAAASESAPHPSSQLVQLCLLPGDVPILPTSFKSRPHAHEQLVAALLDSGGSRSTAVTAPKSRVSSQGMGGVGKTMLTAAVVRDERVRGAFESIAWIGMSQQPELLQLQAKLYQQLHPQNIVMPSKAISLDAGRRELVLLCSKRVVLVCFDDVWDSSHEASFACIDTDTASRQLITTRIKGLLQGAAEVELELLGLQESVELLAGVACLDDAEISPVCLEIAQLCGRLPLCLSIVGNLIRTFGDGWESEVPSILRTDMRSLAETGSGSNKEHAPLNLQQRVIQSGLDSIFGADAEGVVSLFKAMAVFAEDQVVPVAVLSTVWVSIDPNTHKPLSSMTVRAWVSQLLSRSILLGSPADGVSMHDIVRDFTLASRTSIELQHLQQAFISTIISSIDEKSAGNQSHAALYNYTINHLAYHVRSAVTAPFASDSLATRLLLNKDQEIVAQSLAGVNLPDAVGLAKQFEQENTAAGYWSACQLYKSIALNAAGLDKDARCRHFHSALSAAKNLTTKKQPGALTAQILILNKLLVFGHNDDEVATAAATLIKHAQLDASDVNPQDIAAFNGSKQYVGLLLFGQFRTPLSLNSRSLAQLQEGASMFIEGSTHKYSKQILNAVPGNSYERYYILNGSLYPVAGQTVSLVQSSKLREYINEVCGELSSRAREAFEEYDSSRYHARCFAQSGFDVFVGFNNSANVSFAYVADVALTDNVWTKWEAAAIFSINHSHIRYFHWNWLLIHDTRLLERALSMCHVSWDVSETQSEVIGMCTGAYTLQKDGHEVFNNTPKTVQYLAQGLLAARLPHLAEEAEVPGLLPAAEAQFDDVIFQLFGTGVPLSLVCSLVAQHLGDRSQALMYAKAELLSNLNPLKQTLAQMALAIPQCFIDDEGE